MSVAASLPPSVDSPPLVLGSVLVVSPLSVDTPPSLLLSPPSEVSISSLVHVALQPSPSSVLPSSQYSPAVSHSSSSVGIPSPHGVSSKPSPTIKLSMPKLPSVVLPPMLRPMWIRSMRSGADTPQNWPDAELIMHF